MPNQNLINEEQLPGNLVPVETPTVVPGRASVAAPPVPHDMPQFFSGSLAPQLQHDVSFYGTTMASPLVPKYDIMPLGLQASAFTNAAAQSTATAVVAGSTSGADADFYQIVQGNGASLIQRGVLNFKPAAIFNITDNPSNNSTDVALFTDVANGVPTLDGSGYLHGSEFPAFTGDVSKPAGSLATTVIAWQNIPVSATAPTPYQIMQYSGTAWTPIDMPAGASGTLYLDNAASPIGGGYLSLISTFPTTAEQTVTASGTSGTSPVLAAAWASSAVNVTTIAQGTWTPSIYAAVDSLTQAPQMLIRIYTRTSGGTETLQTTFTVTLTATGVTLYTPTIELGNIATNPTDVIVVKIYLQANGASSRTLTVYYDGTTHVSHLHLPSSTVNAVRSEYVNAQTGTTYTFVDSDRGKLVTFSNTSAVAASLPQPNTATFIAGWFCDVQNNNKGAVTITPTSATINGLSSITLLKGQGIRIVSDGTNYQVVGTFIAGTPLNTYVPAFNSTNGDIEWTAPPGGSGMGGVNVQTANYLLVAGDNGKDVVANSGSAISFTLPSPPPSTTWAVFIENIGAGVLTVNRNSLNIDGAAANLTVNQNQGVVIFTDGTNYFTERGLGVVSLNGLSGTLSLTSTGGTIAITPSGSTIDLEATGTASPVKSTATISGTVAAGASATGTVTMAKAFMILGYAAGLPVRIRLYSTAAARTADAARSTQYPPTPGTQNGVIADMYLDTSDKYTNWMCSPAQFGFNWDGSPGGSAQTTTIYYSITNIDSISHTYSISIYFVQMQS